MSSNPITGAWPVNQQHAPLHRGPMRGPSGASAIVMPPLTIGCRTSNRWGIDLVVDVEDAALFQNRKRVVVKEGIRPAGSASMAPQSSPLPLKSHELLPEVVTDEISRGTGEVSYDIQIQFLAYQVQDEDSAPRVNSATELYLTTNYAGLPAVTSHALSLVQASCGTPGLYGLLEMDKESPFVNWTIPFGSMSSEEKKEVLLNLKKRPLYVQVWHGEAEILIGTAQIPLGALLDGAGVRATHAAEVSHVLPEVESDSAPAKHGELHVSLTKLTRRGGSPAFKHLHMGSLARGGGGGALSESMRERVRGEGRSGGASSPFSTQYGSDSEEDEEGVLSSPAVAHRRKGRSKTTTRLEPLPLYARPPPRDRTNREMGRLREETEDWREGKKSSLVVNQAYGRLVKPIFEPIHGSLCFMEIPIENSSNTEQLYTIEFNEACLALVRDAEQWRTLKRRAGIDGDVEENMFLSETENATLGSKLNGGHGQGSGAKLFLGGGESASIPLIYAPQGFDRNQNSQHHDKIRSVVEPVSFHGGWSPWNPAPVPIEQKNIPITIRAVSTWVPAGTIELNVSPKETVVHRTLHFQEKAGSLAVRKISLPEYLPAKIKIETEAGSGAASSLLPPTTSEQDDTRGHVRLSWGVGGKGSRQRFFVHIFSEENGGFDPIETWQVLTEAYEAGEVTAMIGESSQLALPKEMRGALEVWTSDSSLKWNGASGLIFNPHGLGTRQIIVSARMPGRGVARSALLECMGCPARVRQTYEVIVQPDRATHIELSYTSPYREGTLLVVSTNQPRLLSLSPQDGRQWFEAHEEADLGISVRSLPSGTSFSALIFLNDSHDRTVDCFAVHVSCAGAKPAERTRSPRSPNRRSFR